MNRPVTVRQRSPFQRLQTLGGRTGAQHEPLGLQRPVGFGRLDGVILGLALERCLWCGQSSRQKAVVDEGNVRLE